MASSRSASLNSTAARAAGLVCDQAVKPWREELTAWSTSAWLASAMWAMVWPLAGLTTAMFDDDWLARCWPWMNTPCSRARKAVTAGRRVMSLMQTPEGR
ncbi:hypothetical protein D3C76_796560 [compost metagenome]